MKTKIIVPVLLIAFPGGCSGWKAQWAYDRLEVNQASQSEARSMLPGDVIETPVPGKETGSGPVVCLTPVSLFYFKEGKTPPAQELILFLLDPKGLVVGKLWVKSRQEHWGVAKKTVASLKGELAAVSDPNGGEGGPAGQLRLVCQKLRKKQFDFSADRAHAVACAAILRTLEALPGVTASPADHQHFAAHLTLIPPNGSVVIKTTERQSYQFDYRSSSTSRGKLTYSPAQ